MFGGHRAVEFVQPKARSAQHCRLITEQEISETYAHHRYSLRWAR
jgi:hypothetical protein